MSPCSRHVHHRPTFPIQFLPDPRISLVNILPIAQLLLCITQVTHGEQKQKMHSRLSPSSSEASFPWPEWPTSTPAVTLTAPLSQLSPCLSVSGSTLATVLSSVAKNGWTKLFLARNVSSKFRKETFHEHNPIHVLQTVLLSLLLAHGQAKTKSVYPFPRNSIVPTSQQWRENNFVWNVSVQWNRHDSCLGNR